MKNGHGPSEEDSAGRGLLSEGLMTKALAAAALLILSLMAAVPAKAILPTDRVSYSTMTATGGTPIAIVPAQGAGLRIAVVSYEVSCTTPATGGTTFSWATKDNAPADILSSTMTLYSPGLLVSPYVPNGSIVTPANQSLMLNVGTALQTCAVNILWFLIQQ